MQTLVGHVIDSRFASVRRGFVVWSVVVVAMLTMTAVVVGSGAQRVAAASSDNYYVIAGTGGSPARPGSTGTASTSVGFASPSAITSDASGNLIVADTLNHEIDLVVEASATQYDISGVLSPVVGDTYVLAGGGSTTPSANGAAATSVTLNAPAAVAIDSTGNVLVADTYGNEIDVIAETVTNPGYVISGTWIRGDLYVIAGGGAGGTPTVGGLVATSATLNGPSGIAVDPSGNVVVADSANDEIDLLVMHLSGSGAGRVDGDIYVIAGGGSGGAPSATGVTASNVQLSTPKGVIVDAFGNDIIADTNHDAIDVIASSASDPGYGVGGAWTVGDIYRIVGGGSSIPSPTGVAANQSELNAPQGLAIDARGNLLVADVHNYAVDVLAVSSSNPGYALATGASWTVGDLYEIAGGGLGNASGSGSVASQTYLYAPIGVTSLADGSIAVIDQGSKLVERLYLSPSMPLSLSATAGDSSAGLNWTQPVSTGGYPILDYVVSIFDDGGTIPIKSIDLGSTATSTTVTALTDGVAYDFTVEATNAIGTSVGSAEASVTPVGTVTVTTSPSTPPTTPPPTTLPPSTSASPTSTTTPPPTTLPPSMSASPTPPTTVAPAAPEQVQVPQPSSSSTTQKASGRPRVSLLSGNHRVTAHRLSLALRCRSGSCEGSITLTERHEVTKRSKHGSVTVIEVSVVARGSYRDPSRSTKNFRVSLTSFGRRALSASSKRGIAVVATVTARGGPSMVSHLHIV